LKQLPVSANDGVAAADAQGKVAAADAGLLRAALLAGVRTAVQMGASFLSVKVTSVFLGPAGIGTVAQLQGFMSVTLGTVADGVNKGIVRGTAEYGDDLERRRVLLSTAARGLFGTGVPVALAIVVASPLIARHLLGDERYSLEVALFGALYLCGLFACVVNGLANGLKDFGATTLMHVGSILSGLALFVLLSPQFGVAGGLAAAALGPFSLLVLSTLVARRRPWFDRSLFTARFSSAEFRRLAAFLPMAAAATFGESFGQTVVRDALARHAGMHEVGLLQGVWRLSDMYLSVFLYTFSMYYLARFAEIKDTAELRREIGRAALLVIPAVALTSAVLYAMRDLVIELIFTHEFVGMRDLFGWQMVGNVVKTAGVLFGYVLLARVAPLKIAAIELVKGGAWIAFAYLFIPSGGGVGAVQAYVATYAVYLLVTAAYVALLTRRRT
jgi:PST family polysaccharide transporter